MEYIVKVIQVSGKGNRVFNFGDPVTEKHFPEGQAKVLEEKGYLELTKDAKKEVAQRKAADKKTAAELVEKYEANLEKATAELEKVTKPKKLLKTYQKELDAAQKKTKTAAEALQVAADDVVKAEKALGKAKDADKEKAEKALADAKDTHKAATELSETSAEDVHTALTELEKAQDALKTYSDLERNVTNAEALLINSKKQLKKLS